jgi:GDP/UDP-N,N'-diacetylbacillosamine 2-epimerase (hydrolysing)
MTNAKRKILFVTERRADYSRLKPIMNAVRHSEKLELQLVVTGMHLLPKFGETVNVIESDGFHIDARLPMFDPSDQDEGASMVRGLGRAVLGFADLLPALKPDLIFAGFDIGANFAAAIAGMHMNIHVSHIQGGEVSGTVDEVIRHGLTKFAHIHFAATEESRNRIIRLGEDPKYVFNVGSPSLDTIHSAAFLPKADIFAKYHLLPDRPLILLLQHPVTTEVDEVLTQITQTIQAVKDVGETHPVQVLAIYSNNDAGGKRIVDQLEGSGITVEPHIPYEDFLNLMKYADALVGNSSAGIHEAPSFGLPVVNIGTRQQLRERGVNVIDVDNDRRQIVSAIQKALFDQDFIRTVKNGKNPYDNGDTAKKIIDILEHIELPPIQKVITY